MEPQQYYAYNQTREAFLSLNVTIVDQAGEPFWAALSQSQLKSCESIWLSGVTTGGEMAYHCPCDRIYLNKKLQVVALQESAIAFPDKTEVDSFASVLMLPMHAIFSSQTQEGDQILIGTIEDIGAILDGAVCSTRAPEQ